MITMPSTWGQWLAAIIALFLVPALGSAFWEFLAKPLLVGTTDRIRNGAMRLLTLNSHRAQRRFFISVGRRELLHPAVGIWAAASIGAVGVVGGTAGEYVYRVHPQPVASWALCLLCAMYLGIALLMTYRFMRTLLVAAYVHRFDHTMEIAGPFLLEKERLIARSRYALVDSADSYKYLIKLLRDTSVARGDALNEEWDTHKYFGLTPPVK